MFKIIGFYEESGEEIVFGIMRNSLKYGLGTFNKDFKQLVGGLFIEGDEDDQKSWEKFVLVST
jgi:hypothetical protein